MSNARTRAIRAVTPTCDAEEVLPAWKPPLSKYGEYLPPLPLDDTPADIAHAKLAASVGPFGDDAKALSEVMIWEAVNRWWGRLHSSGHQEASMMGAEFGYLLQGKPSRLAEVMPDATERREYHQRAAAARLEWELASCPGLLNLFNETIVFFREAIIKRDAA